MVRRVLLLCLMTKLWNQIKLKTNCKNFTLENALKFLGTSCFTLKVVITYIQQWWMAKLKENKLYHCFESDLNKIIFLDYIHPLLQFLITISVKCKEIIFNQTIQDFLMINSFNILFSHIYFKLLETRNLASIKRFIQFELFPQTLSLKIINLFQF